MFTAGRYEYKNKGLRSGCVSSYWISCSYDAFSALIPRFAIETNSPEWHTGDWIHKEPSTTFGFRAPDCNSCQRYTEHSPSAWPIIGMRVLFCIPLTRLLLLQGMTKSIYWSSLSNASYFSSCRIYLWKRSLWWSCSCQRWRWKEAVSFDLTLSHLLEWQHSLQVVWGFDFIERILTFF